MHSFKLRPVAPFRLDLTVWALRRRRDNLVDRWDGSIYRRLFVLDAKAVDVVVVQSGSPDKPELNVEAGAELSPHRGIKNLSTQDYAVCKGGGKENHVSRRQMKSYLNSKRK